MVEIKKKKIIILITKSNFGGAQRYVYDLATSLPKESFDVLVISGEGEEMVSRLKQSNIRTIHLSSLQRDVNIPKDLKVFFNLIKIFRAEKPDIIHLNSTKIGGIGAVAGKLCRVHNIIFTAHDWAFNNARGKISKKIMLFLQWLTVLLSHTTIAVSQKTADQISSLPLIKKDKIKVIYNGVTDIDFLERVKARQLLLPNRSEKKRENELWIGTMSELHYRKGLDVMIDVFSELSKKYAEMIFVVMGSGEEREKLITQIQKTGLSDKIFLVGQMLDAKKYLKAFDVFTLTSRTEALPYALLEAGLAGLPVIASAVGGVPEVINSAETGILVPTGEHAVSAVTSALDSLIKSKEKRLKLGNNLKLRVCDQFSKKKMCEETFALYK